MKTILIIILFLSSITLCAKEPRVKGLLDGMGLDSEVSKQELNFTCHPKLPPKNPAQHSSAEGLPPLPLPVVLLRRTEKKNPPRPPVLVVKIVTDNKSDWGTNPNDINNLLKWMAKEFGVHFSSENKSLNDVLGLKKVPAMRARIDESKEDVKVAKND